MKKLKIEVLYAGGCGSCKRIEYATNAAISELGLDIPVERLTDYREAQERGASQVPALFINGKLVVQGRYPSTDEIKDIIRQHMGLITDISTF
jgi:small redox-active disulfide protein 2